jgi:hypothetical protein
MFIGAEPIDHSLSSPPGSPIQWNATAPGSSSASGSHARRTPRTAQVGHREVRLEQALNAHRLRVRGTVIGHLAPDVMRGKVESGPRRERYTATGARPG